MKRGISLKALADKIDSNREAKHDFTADTRSLEVDVLERKPVLLAQGQAYPLLPVALRQLATHTGVPSQYLDRMIERSPRLAADNLNEWLHLDPSRRLVRTMRHDARAFLSDRYQRIENEEIAEVVLPILADVPGIEVVSTEVTDKRLYIQAVTSRIQGEVKVGDPVQAGVLISNSEVGLGSVSISALIWRLICLNGAKMPDGNLKARHVGRRLTEDEDLDAIYRDDTRQADDRAVLLKVRDTVQAALSEVHFNRRIDQMKQLADPAARIVNSPEKAIEVLAKKVGANEGERKSILQSLMAGNDLTAWGLINAVTAQAHVAEYDRGVEFEDMGGKLITLPAKEWREVLEAA
jgi:hypothetical protein